MTTLSKKISIMGGAIGILVGLMATVGVNQNSFFEPRAAAPTPGLYSLTIDNTVEFNTGSKNAVITKQIGTTTLSILYTNSLTFSATNRLPITFSAPYDADDDPFPPSIFIAQIQNIRSVNALFTSPSGVDFHYRYLNIVNNNLSGGIATIIESNVSSNTTYNTALKNGGVGNNSYPDSLLITFPFDVSITLTSLTITYDC